MCSNHMTNYFHPLKGKKLNRGIILQSLDRNGVIFITTDDRVMNERVRLLPEDDTHTG